MKSEWVETTVSSLIRILIPNEERGVDGVCLTVWKHGARWEWGVNVETDSWDAGGRFATGYADHIEEAQKAAEAAARDFAHRILEAL